jgi:hypothetical protein
MPINQKLNIPDPPDPNASNDEIFSLMFGALYRDQQSAYDIGSLNNSLNLQLPKDRQNYLDALLSDHDFITRLDSGVLKLTPKAIKAIYETGSYLKYLEGQKKLASREQYTEGLAEVYLRGQMAMKRMGITEDDLPSRMPVSYLPPIDMPKEKGKLKKGIKKAGIWTIASLWKFIGVVAAAVLAGYLLHHFLKIG